MGEASFGKYRLIAELGHGGMADVFLAVQAGPIGSNFRKLSVIKRLRENLVEEPEFVEMLIDEARIAARLNHPNVVQTNEVGEFDGQYFIEMEYLDGQPLHRIQHRALACLKAGRPSPVLPEQQMIVVMDSLAGLHHAHDLTDYDGSPLSIVHRDVTPQNIFVTYAGQVKVVDFGIAKAAGRASETRQGVVKGKVRYMAPEQALGQHVDRRADVFSMGVILWEVITGTRMWRGHEELEIVRLLVSGQYPASPRLIDPNIPVALDRICQKALAHDRDNRYATAEDFRLDLEQFLSDSRRLVEARRRLAPGVMELFVDKRTEIKAVIEKQLASLQAVGSGEFDAVPMPLDSVSSGMHYAQTLNNQRVNVQLTDSMAGLDTSVSHREMRNRRFRNAAVSGAAVALIVCAVAMLALRLRQDRVATAAPMPSSTEVTLRLTATPPIAKISIDDGPELTVPAVVHVARDQRSHHVRFQADGFVARTEALPFRDDLAMSVALTPVPADDRPAAPAAKAGRAPGPGIAPPPPPRVTAAAPPPVDLPAAVSTSTTTPNDMPFRERKKPKTELDNADPWKDK